MLKKILSFLCLISLATSTNCMNDELADFSAHESDQCPHKELKLTLDQLVFEENEKRIIEMLQQNAHFIASELSYILDVLSKNKLITVINYIQDNFIIDDKDLLMCAVNLGYINTVIELTHFDRYVEADILDFQQFLADSKVTPEILDEIIIYNKINYQNLDGVRYLQTHIRNQNVYQVSNFIKGARVSALNAQEHATGSTALHEAAFAWERNNDNDSYRTDQEQIIKELLEHGANPEIPNNNDVLASELVFFNAHSKLCWEWQANYHIRTITKKSQPLRKIRPHQIKKTSKKINNKRRFNMVAAAGLSLAGAALIYVCYNMFNKKTVNNSIRLK